MAGGVPAGRLSIEIVAEIARLQQDLDRAKRLVNAASGDIARSARAANDNLAAMGAGAGRAGQSYAAAGRQIVASAGAQRAGIQQVAYNVQDLGVQFGMAIQSGDPFRMMMMAIAQQAPQTVSAIQLMTGSTKGFIGFMGGPWGAVLMGAVTILGSLAFAYANAEDATKKVEFASNALKDVQGILGNMFDLTTGKINTQSSALTALAQAQLLVARVQAQARQAEARSQIAGMTDAQLTVSGGMGGGVFAGYQQGPTAGIARRVLDGTNTAKQALDQLENLRSTGRITGQTFSEAAAAIANYGVETENLTVLGKGLTSMLNGELDPALRKVEAASKPKTDRRAETLAREAEATEALIAGLARLADAYLEGDAAAIRAQITAKATEQGIRKQADVEAYVAQQVRLAAAQRIADGAKVVSEMRAQSDAQQLVNNQVAQGLMTADEAQEFLKNEAQLRPLITALSLAEGAAKEQLTKVIAALRNEQKRANDETERAQSLARAEQIRRRTSEMAAESGLDSEMAARRLNIMATSGNNRAAEREALRQLNIEHEKHLIMLRAEAEIKALGSRASAEEIAEIQARAAAEANAAASKSNVAAAVDAMEQLRDLASELDFSAFGAGGQAIEGMIDAMDRLSEAQAAYNLLKDNDDPAVRAKAEGDYTKAKLAGTMQIIGSSKRLFHEESGMYKALMAFEKALAAIQMINTIKSIAMDTMKTTSSVANAGARTAADTAAGGAKMFSFLGPFAFPVVAAMIAVMASLGFKGSGKAGAPAIPTAEELQEQAGTGTVLGDSKAKSNSIANSLEIVASNTNRDLEYSNDMLRALRSIDNGISKLSGNVARQISVAGGMFDTSGARLGSSGSSGFLGLFGSSTTRTLWDVGMDIFSTSIADILQNGIGGRTYQIVQQIKKKSGFLGIGGGTSTTYQTSYGQIDPSITDAIQGVIYSLREGLLSAAKVVGLDGAAAILDNFRVEIGRLSFKDMSGEEIEQQLNAVFSKVGDQMAGAILPLLYEVQKVGEGAFETFMRLARQYQVIDISLKSIGLTFGAVGVASLKARDDLIQLFGSLDDFTEQVDFYRENFLTEAEQIAPIYAAVTAEMERLGLASVDTISEFKGVINGLDLTTQAGRDLFAAMMAVAPAFSAVEKYQDKMAKEWEDRAKSLTDYRDSLLGSSTSSLASIMAQYRQTADAARMGDAAALDGLKSASEKFLDAARANATSEADYLRARAEVVNNLDGGINAANTQAELARRTTAAVESMQAEIASMRSESTQLATQVATNTATTNRILERFEGEGLPVRTADDTTLNTSVAA